MLESVSAAMLAVELLCDEISHLHRRYIVELGKGRERLRIRSTEGEKGEGRECRRRERGDQYIEWYHF